MEKIRAEREIVIRLCPLRSKPRVQRLERPNRIGIRCRKIGLKLRVLDRGKNSFHIVIEILRQSAKRQPAEVHIGARHWRLEVRANLI